MTVEAPRGSSVKTPWYKKAIVPWIIVTVLLSTSLGFIGGWMGHMDMSQDIKAQAHDLLNLSKASQ